VLFAALFCVCLGADLASKHYVFSWLLSDPASQARLAVARQARGDNVTAREALRFFRRPLLPGVEISLSVNAGIAFGLPARRLLVAAATVLAVGMVGYFFATADARARSVHVALALIGAGALGNLYDRLASEVVVPGFEPIRHHVRDFIDCSQLHWPWVFNVADAWLVVGVAVLILHWMLTGRKARRASAGPEQAAGRRT